MRGGMEVSTSAALAPWHTSVDLAGGGPAGGRPSR